MVDNPQVELAINTIRTLSIDAVQHANSGHPGTPMALAPAVYTLWNRIMRFDPQDPIWPNRDRFVLSNGHASMLLWSVLHLTRTQAVNADYESVGHPAVSLEDIRRFRQLDSRAPGHPEYHWTSGVETTTGPLGQGVATSVGMAIAQKWLANRYNRPGFDIFDYNAVNESPVGVGRDFIDNFEGAGFAFIDRIDLSTIDARDSFLFPGNQAFSFVGVFGPFGIGTVRVVNVGANTLVQVNTDFDAAAEMEILVDDGAANAFNWVATDFIL